MSRPLASLVAELRACRICRDTPRFGPALPHEPRPVIQASLEARILIAGQAPGTRVHASGRPFTDPSGIRLRQWLDVDEDTFYDASKFAIVPIGHCFPGLDSNGSDLPPRRECAMRWRQDIMNALPLIQLVVVIGQYARDWHLPEYRKSSLTQTMLEWKEISNRSVQPRIIPLPHPSWRNSSWLKKNPWFKDELLPELQETIAKTLA